MQTTSSVISAQRQARKICAPAPEATQRVVPISTGSRIRSSLRSCMNDRTEDCSAVIRTTSGSKWLMLSGKGYWLVQRRASRPAVPVSCGSQISHCAVGTRPPLHNRSILLSPTLKVAGLTGDGIGPKRVASRSKFYSASQFVYAFESEDSPARSVRFTGVLR